MEPPRARPGDEADSATGAPAPSPDDPARRDDGTAVEPSAGPGPWRCAADPSVETYLRCGRCERPICPRCLIQTPVGARCRACARLRRLPMFQVGPRHFLLGIGAGLGAGYAGAIVLTLLQSMVPVLGLFGILLLLAFGYVVGEAVARATSPKRGPWLGAIAALAVPIGLILARATLFSLGGMSGGLALYAGAVSLLTSLWLILGLLVAAAIAYGRLR